MKYLLTILLLLAPVVTQAQEVSTGTHECVILLHGLARTDKAMIKLKDTLIESGYTVVNVYYPSRKHTVEELADLALTEGLTACEATATGKVNIVTHSLGGILVRQYLQEEEIDNLNRVVMLGPPNQGSEVVDKLAALPGYEWLNGPAGMQLGTAEDDLPKSLGAVNFELGIIAGNKTINPILSQYLPNPDDGKVSVASTRVKGMCAFLELPVSHALMMRDKEVLKEVLAFLETGEFVSETAENGLCDQ